MDYNLSTKPGKLVTEVTTPEYSVSLARVGGQGSKGDSIENVYINSDRDLVVEVVNSAGTITEIIAGNLNSNERLSELLDVTINNIADGDFLAYEASSANFKNYRLTTSKLQDIDNTNKQDGALLVYSSNTAKYTATNQLNNPNTLIIGGDY